MMKNFVICHEQKIADKSKLKNQLPNLQWVMVGNNKFKSGIIARKLPKNIENHPYLVAYTAWHALAHNGYIDDNEYYGIFEYDIQVAPHFTQTINQYKQQNMIIGFIPFSVDHILFMGRGTELLRQAIRTVYGVDVQKVIYDELAKDRRLWCSTSNCVIYGKHMKAFVEWFDPLILHFGRNLMAAHFPERAIRIFMALYNIEPMCIQNIFKHEQKKSHKIEYALI